MKREDVAEVMAKPISQELLGSSIPARLAYVGIDGEPRVIPIGFWWTGEHVVMATVPTSAKVRALRQNPRVAITIDTQDQWPPRVLLIRGAARLELVDGVPDDYIEASRKVTPAEHFESWEQGVRALYDQMVVITIDRTGRSCWTSRQPSPRPSRTSSGRARAEETTMTRYMLLTKYDDSIGAGPMSEWDPDDITAHLEFLRAVNRELIDNGELVDMQALTGPELAKIVTFDGQGSPVVTDGPYPEVKEVLAGYQMVDVESEARAIEIAARVSAAPGPGGVPLRQRIEVRQVMSAVPVRGDL